MMLEIDYSAIVGIATGWKLVDGAIHSFLRVITQSLAICYISTCVNRGLREVPLDGKNFGLTVTTQYTVKLEADFSEAKDYGMSWQLCPPPHRTFPI